MKKAFYILLIFSWAIPSGFAQLKTYSFEEAEKLAKENPKPFVVFVHTSWCNYCKMMENSTYKNPEIISTLYLWMPKAKQPFISTIIRSNLNQMVKTREFTNSQRHWQPLIRKWFIPRLLFCKLIFR